MGGGSVCVNEASCVEKCYIKNSFYYDYILVFTV